MYASSSSQRTTLCVLRKTAAAAVICVDCTSEVEWMGDNGGGSGGNAARSNQSARQTRRLGMMVSMRCGLPFCRRRRFYARIREGGGIFMFTAAIANRRKRGLGDIFALIIYWAGHPRCHLRRMGTNGGCCICAWEGILI